MTGNNHLDANYRDILSGEDDPKLRGLVSRLDSQLGYRVEQAPDQLVASIRHLARDEAGRQADGARLWHQRWSSWRLPRRKRALVPILAVCLLIAAVLTGTTYAALPTFERVFKLNSDVGVVFPQGTGEKVNISRTIDGYTMTVRSVAADANEIVIGYTLSGPPGHHINSMMAWGKYDETPGQPVAETPILTDAAGHELDGGGAPVGNVSTGSGAFANMLVYATPKVPEGTDTVQVHLTVESLSANEPVSKGGVKEVVVKGPIQFDLSIPVRETDVAPLTCDQTIGTFYSLVATPASESAATAAAPQACATK